MLVPGLAATAALAGASHGALLDHAWGGHGCDATASIDEQPPDRPTDEIGLAATPASRAPAVAAPFTRKQQRPAPVSRGEQQSPPTVRAGPSLIGTSRGPSGDGPPLPAQQPRLTGAAGIASHPVDSVLPEPPVTDVSLAEAVLSVPPR